MKKKILLGILIFLLVVILAGVFFVYPTMKPYMVSRRVSSSFKAETTTDVGGPFRGMYHIYAYYADDGDPSAKYEAAVNTANEYPDETLALVEINLKGYRAGDISDTGLKNIKGYLDTVIGTGKDLIVRFLYDWDGNGEKSVPDDISIIKRHITQVAPLLNDRRKHIFILQGTFVGSYGEMHSSAFCDDESTKELLNHLHLKVDREIYLAVRTPRYYRASTGILIMAGLSNVIGDHSVLSDRLSLFNDGMLGSESDTGTYGELSLVNMNGEVLAACREDELKFQSQLCKYVPNGGEVINKNKYNGVPNAVADLSTMHVSYLNSEYDPKVLKKWKKKKYSEGKEYGSGYDYIKAHLGYRYVVSKVNFENARFPEKKDKVSIEITNTGFAPYYRPVFLQVKIVDMVGNESFPEIKNDLRDLFPGEKMTIEIELPKKEYMSGEYRFRIKASDDLSGALIPFANEDNSDSNGWQEIGVYRVGK